MLPNHNSFISITSRWKNCRKNHLSNSPNNLPSWKRSNPDTLKIFQRLGYVGEEFISGIVPKTIFTSATSKNFSMKLMTPNLQRK